MPDQIVSRLQAKSEKQINRVEWFSVCFAGSSQTETPSKQRERKTQLRPQHRNMSCQLSGMNPMISSRSQLQLPQLAVLLQCLLLPLLLLMYFNITQRRGHDFVCQLASVCLAKSCSTFFSAYLSASECCPANLDLRLCSVVVVVAFAVLAWLATASAPLSHIWS